MHILGISCFYHDAAAALVSDGHLVAAAEEERFSRRKHDFNFPSRAIAFCLEQGGCSARDLDLVVFYEKPFWKLDRILMSVLATFPRSMVAFREAMLVWLLDKMWVRDLIRERLGCPRRKIVFCPHHLSHAASAFYCSGLDRAAVLTVDGVGEWATATRGTAWGNRILLDEEMHYPHSLGLLYSAFTAFLGFEVNEGEYKVMGMAAYGQPRFLDLIFDKLVKLHEDGSFRLDMDYFAYHYSACHSFNERFTALFGRPRRREESNFLDPHYADVAASIQKATEEILVRQATWLNRRTGHDSLVMAGGVALNSVANYRILTESGFRRLYIQPAAGDGGGALGAALWGYHEVLGQPRSDFHLRHCAWGQEHDDAAVADFLRRQGVSFRELDDPCDEVVERLCQGQVVGWMQGRFEWGPRALGQRSILADPREAGMKDVVNARIKFREPFRPFAPSVLAERVGEYFELADADTVDPARFMLLVTPVRPRGRELLPAVTHVDGTARIQAVHRAESPLYHRLIERFAQASGVPVLLNTSFNLRGEPIVNTPAEAYATFARSDMDALVMGRFLVSRRAAGEGRQISAADLQAWSARPARIEEADVLPLAAGASDGGDRGHGLFGVAAPEPRRRLSPGQLLGRAAGFVVAALLLLELALRHFVPNPNLQVRGLYVEDAQGIHLRPGWRGTVHTAEFRAPIEISALGLRDPRPGALPERLRILALGDSFTFGCWSPEEKTWVRRTEQALGEERFQLINAGAPNYGTDSAARFLERQGWGWHPQVVLLAFYSGNDFYDNMVGAQAYTVEGGYLVMREEAARRWGDYNCLSRSLGAPFDTLAGASPLVSDASGLASAGSTLRALARGSYLYQFGAGLWYGRHLWGQVRPHEAEAWFLKDYRPEMDEAVVRTRRYLDEILARTRERGVPLAVVVIPSHTEVYDEDWQAWLRARGLEEGLFDRAKPGRLVAEWARQNGVPCLDLAPAFRGRERMYYRADMHWTDLGHFLAADKVAEFLRARVLPEAGP